MKKRPPDPLQVLLARIEARAYLWKENEFRSLEDMMLPLYAYARRTGLLDKLGVEGIDDMMLAALDGRA